MLYLRGGQVVRASCAQRAFGQPQKRSSGPRYVSEGECKNVRDDDNRTTVDQRHVREATIRLNVYSSLLMQIITLKGNQHILRDDPSILGETDRNEGTH